MIDAKRQLKAIIVILLVLQSELFAAEETPASRILEQGIEQLVAKNNDTALKLFNQVILIDPKNAEAYFRLGQVYLNKKDAKKAVEMIRKSTEIEPLNLRYSLNLASFYENANNNDLAKKEYQRIIDTGTLDKRVKEAEKRLALISGRELGKKGEYNAALLVFNGLLLDYPNDPEILFNIGMAYVFLDRVQEAEVTLTKLLSLEPTNPVALLNLANIFERTNRPEDAMRHLKIIIDQNLNNEIEKVAKIQYGIVNGRELLKRKDWVAAAQSFQEVVQLDPKRTEAFFNIALANLSLGNLIDAEKGFLAVIKVTPEDFSARLNLGGLYFDSGKFDQAKEHFQYIIDNDKNGKYRQQAQLRLNIMHTALADKALQEGKVQESLVEYKKALDYYSGNVRASFNRGIIFIQQKQFDLAKIEFDSVVRFDPNNLRARINLAMVYEQLNQLTNAAEQYEIILQIDKASEEGKIAQAKWKITKARGLWADKHLTAAENLFEDIVSEQPENFEAFAYLGIIQQSKGKLQEAAGSFQRVMSLRPGNSRVRLMLANVYEQLGLDNLAATEYRSILFNGAETDVIGDANNRLTIVETRLSGFSNTLNYQVAYDSNANMNDANPANEVRSDLALDVIYGYKVRDDFSLRISWAPTYSSFHINQGDFLRSVLQSSMVMGRPEQSWIFSLGRQDQQNVLIDQDVSDSTDGSVTFTRKLFMKALFGLSPVGFEGERIATGMSATLSGRYVRSFGGTRINNVGANAGFSFNQGLRNGVNTTLAYQFGIIRNQKNIVILNDRTFTQRNPLTGLTETLLSGNAILYDSRDYEMNTHTASLFLNRVLGPGVSGGFSSSLVFSDYVNEDSSARISNREEFRKNLTMVVSGNLNYHFFKDMSFSAGMSIFRNFSSMETGFSNADATVENRVAERDRAVATFQSSSLGDFTRITFNSGFVMTF